MNAVNVSLAIHNVVVAGTILAAFGALLLVLQAWGPRKGDRLITNMLGGIMFVFGAGAIVLALLSQRIATPAWLYAGPDYAMGVAAAVQLVHSGLRWKQKTDKWRHTRFFLSLMCIAGGGILAAELHLLLDSSLGASAGKEPDWAFGCGWAAQILAIITVGAAIWDLVHKVPDP